MLMEKVKEMLGTDEVSEDVEPFYSRADDLREALYLIREARYRDEQRKSRAMQDLEILQEKEEAFMEEGERAENQTGRVIAAGKVKEIRDKKEEIQHKINNIFKKRIKIYSEHMKSLETIVAMDQEELPSEERLKEYAVRAREKLEQLEDTFSMAEGVDFATEGGLSVTREEKEIMEEFDRKKSGEREKEGASEGEERSKEEKMEEAISREEEPEEDSDREGPDEEQEPMLE